MGRAVTSAATTSMLYYHRYFLVVQLLFKIDSAASIPTTFKHCANR